jgi:DNA-binding NtrC family response regulator
MSAKSSKVLIVDDEPDMAENLERLLRNRGYATVVETDSRRAMACVEREEPDLVLTDMRMPGLDGMALLELIKSRQGGIPVIVLTGYASVSAAVEAMHKGATDYLAKPVSPEELVLKVEKALTWKQLMEENRYLQEGCGGRCLTVSRLEDQKQSGKIIGQHPALQGILELVEKVAPTDTRIMLVGESGTGKDLLAQTIHQDSLRRQAPFFAINCGALTESLLESELFGYERGAFTGAMATKKGIFEAAQGGTLFLDEITETSLVFQTKLLRVVETGDFMRVGGTRPLQADVRLISASNRDPQKAIADGRFREDLFYRLSVVQICLPPLRERVEDIPLLVAHFLACHARQLKKPIRGVQPQTMAALTRYTWPGNIRELDNVIERAVIMAEAGEEILPAHLPFSPPDERETAPEPAEAFKQAESEVLIETLKGCNWNRSLAAKRLGIGRRTLYDKLARLGISLKPNL